MIVIPSSTCMCIFFTMQEADEDFQIALLWLKEMATASDSIKLSQLDVESIYQLNKVLEQESHNLRLTANDLLTYEDKSVLFVQHMLIRSLDLNYTTIADKARRFLSFSKKTVLESSMDQSSQ